MNKRYNILVPQTNKEGKTYWNKVGVMFKREKGGYDIKLNLFPDVKMLAFEPKQENKTTDYEHKPDDIPF